MKVVYSILSILILLGVTVNSEAKNLFSKKDNGFIFVFIENDCGACNVMAASAVSELKAMKVEYKSIVVAESKRIYTDFVDYGLPDVVKKNPVSYFPLKSLKEQMRSDLYYVENGKVVYSYFNNQDLIRLYKPFPKELNKDFSFPSRINLGAQFHWKVIKDSLLFYTAGSYQSFYGLLSLKTGYDYKSEIIKEAKAKFIKDTSKGIPFVFITTTSSVDSGIFHFFGYTNINNNIQRFGVRYIPQTNQLIFKSINGNVKINELYEFSLKDPIQVRNGNYYFNTGLNTEQTKEFYSNHRFIPSFIKLQKGDIQQLSIKGKMPQYYINNFGYINNWKSNFENEGLGLYVYKKYPAILDTAGNEIRLQWEMIKNEDNVKHQDWSIENALNYKNHFLVIVLKDFKSYLAVFNLKGELVCSRQLKESGSFITFSENSLYEIQPKNLGLKEMTLRKLPLN